MADKIAASRKKPLLLVLRGLLFRSRELLRLEESVQK
jgi:hypothetical protein